MQIDGTIQIHRPLALVWESLIDLEFVSQCVPGFESISEVLPNQVYKLVASGSLFQDDMRIEIDFIWRVREKPDRFSGTCSSTLLKSRVNADLQAQLRSLNTHSTEVEWSAEIELNGVLREAAGSYLDLVLNRIADRILNCIKQKVEAK